jgi:hypothetical protein
MQFINRSVEPEHIEAMRVAFRGVCDVLQLHCTADDAMTKLVAAKIMELAKSGEHDATRLCEGVLRMLDDVPTHTEDIEREIRSLACCSGPRNDFSRKRGRQATNLRPKYGSVNRARNGAYQDQPGRSFNQGIMSVREDARPARSDPIGAALAYGRRWGPLFLMMLVANTVIATLAWMVVGLFLN